MTSFRNGPRLLKGGLVVLDPDTGSIRRIIALQYNPDSVSRSFQVQAAGVEGGDRSEALRVKAPPIETIKVEAEFDAADQLEVGGVVASQLGIHPQLAELEAIVYPPTEQLLANNRMAQDGILEIAPVQAPLSLFVWSKTRVVPVRVTELSVTEEAFDPSLNPIRAKVSLGLRVLSVYDLGFAHKGGSLYMAYQHQKERLAAMALGAELGALGLRGVSS